MSKNLHVAIVGATGAVGIEMMKTLANRKFPLGKLTLLASARSVGKRLPFHGEEIAVEELTEHSFKGVDVALFSAGGSISKKFAPFATPRWQERSYLQPLGDLHGVERGAFEELIAGDPEGQGVVQRAVGCDAIPLASLPSLHKDC